MAENIQTFIKLANFYNQLTTVMPAICVQKGGIAMENYVGRFFAADALEFITDYGNRLIASGAHSTEFDIKSINLLFSEQLDKVKTLTTPSQKPIFEMTLDEFEKVMNI